MNLPETDIQDLLYVNYIDKRMLTEFAYNLDSINYGGFKEINWLNTPGPIYTTITDNCGTGQIEAISNVSGDEDYREIIFKPPFSKQELKETLNAAACETFGSYYFDGNQNWNGKNILEWWERSEERITYIIKRYSEELHLSTNTSSWKFGSKTFTGRLYGPGKPIPENYKYWLNFYQWQMKEYLEWYIHKIHNQEIVLPALNFDWTMKAELDKIYDSR